MRDSACPLSTLIGLSTPISTAPPTRKSGAIVLKRKCADRRLRRGPRPCWRMRTVGENTAADLDDLIAAGCEIRARSRPEARTSGEGGGGRDWDTEYLDAILS